MSKPPKDLPTIGDLPDGFVSLKAMLPNNVETETNHTPYWVCASCDTAVVEGNEPHECPRCGVKGDFWDLRDE